MDLQSRADIPAPDEASLAKASAPFARVTERGSLAFFTSTRSRSSPFTVYVGSERVLLPDMTPQQKAILANVPLTLAKLRKYLARAPLVKVERVIGDNPEFNVTCTAYQSVQRPEQIRQAYMWSRTLRPRPGAGASCPGPALSLICVPEWSDTDRQVLVFPESGVTVLLGFDYVGEMKMGFLRMAMWEAKQAGMLGLHAGSKIVRVRGANGKIRRVGMLFFGLSGTGKTTHACHDHGLREPGEGIEILQDDIVFLREDGAALGTEHGFYLKTEGITTEHQPILYQSLQRKDALFENVMVDKDGRVDVADVTLTANGRAVVLREAMKPQIADGINLPPLKEMDELMVVFITRRMTVLPPALRLTPEQAAAAFMLGESVETSAGDPRKAGQSVRVVGTNPFIVGNEADEGNWLYRFLQAHRDRVQSYLINTGGMGERSEIENSPGRKGPDGKVVVTRPARWVQISGSAAILRGILRGSATWEADPQFGGERIVTTDGFDLSPFRSKSFYPDAEVAAMVKDLQTQRRDWLARFPTLDPAIAKTVGLA